MSLKDIVRYNLFRAVGVPKEPERSDQLICNNDTPVDMSDSDLFDHYLEEVLPHEYDSKATLLAGTMNIHPLCHIDGKKWRTFTEKEQCEKLRQLMIKYLIGTNYLIDESNYFVEKCPVKGSIHIHFILKDLKGEGSLVTERYFNACLKFKNYKTFKFDEIYDIAGWHTYIRKSIHTPA